MKLFHYILLSSFISCGCGRSEKIESPTPKTIEEKLEYYCSKDIDPYEKVGRCDGLTFLGLYDSYCKRIDIEKHEYTVQYREEKPLYTRRDILELKSRTGKWNRDVLPCFEFDGDGNDREDSRADTSFENAVSALHSIWARKDRDAIIRFLEYAEVNNWVLGNGPSEYTYMPHLRGLVKKIKSKLSDIEEREDIERGLIESLKTYKGKVIASYLDLSGKVYGYLGPLEIVLLKTIHREDPENPIYNKLLGRYFRSSYLEAAEIALMDETQFPSDRLPGHLEKINWGDDLGEAIFAWIVSI